MFINAAAIGAGITLKIELQRFSLVYYLQEHSIFTNAGDVEYFNSIMGRC
jgi:hypothetical protein